MKTQQNSHGFPLCRCTGACGVWRIRRESEDRRVRDSGDEAGCRQAAYAVAKPAAAPKEEAAAPLRGEGCSGRSRCAGRDDCIIRLSLVASARFTEALPVCQQALLKHPANAEVQAALQTIQTNLAESAGQAAEEAVGAASAAANKQAADAAAEASQAASEKSKEASDAAAGVAAGLAGVAATGQDMKEEAAEKPVAPAE